MSEPTRAGGCEWLGDGIRVQYTRCWACMFQQCPGGEHPWADAEDIAHAAAAGHADPSGEKCGCVCADGPELNAEESGACGYDADDRPLVHIEDGDGE